jgi:AraC-like DNA-binding protein
LRSAVVELNAGERLLVDRTTWATIPPDTSVQALVLAPSARLLVLSVSPELIDQVADTYRSVGVERVALQRHLSTLQLLPRTMWVYELCQRYLFEREVLNEHHSDAARFLETELVKEAFFLCRDREHGEDRAPLAEQHSPVVAGALGFIDANLFEPELLAQLARHVGSSESTLLRAFKKELGSTPAAYWRARRLDEALGFLRSGLGSIAEIAARVGYDNPAAFAQAFQLRFGQAPSAFVSARRRRPAPS